ncbi:putative nuclease HARBI1 [Zophobas morio]|uniref:putative nuclease HARBI1 n=1 Tax=Zophobas morio TaxID=2755281 RepID=UPI003082AC85
MSASTLSSLSDESDEEGRLQAARIRRPRRFFVRKDPFELYDDMNFKERYRINKNTFNELLNLIGHHLEPATKRNHSISAKLQLLVTLRFLASASFQQVLGDNIGIHRSSTSRIITRVCNVIAALKPRYIKMPVTGQERRSVKSGFHNIRGFPKVIGALDCTHVKILSPGGEQAERFRNRKGYFSINVQGVCDSELKIINIIARWPGSVHDSTIFNDSPLCADLASGVYGTDFVLGDNGYPCRSYLLTPLLNPRNRMERAYNAAHKASRNCIERCFGVLKRRFPCLSRGLNMKLQSTLHIIVACAVLHNICILEKDAFFEGEDQDVDEDPELHIFNNENTAVRVALINSVFADL